MSKPQYPTLDVFLTSSYPRNSYVNFPGMDSLYVRKGGYLINDKIVQSTIQIASVESSHPGDGAFRKLIDYLRFQYSDMVIVVECVHSDLLAEILVHFGFERINVLSGRHFAKLSVCV